MEIPSFLPHQVTVSLEDVEPSRKKVTRKPHHHFVTDQVDPYDWPLVRAFRRVIPAEHWLNIWMEDDYVPRLETPGGDCFEAHLTGAAQERMRQYDRHSISPAGQLIKLHWTEAE